MTIFEEVFAIIVISYLLIIAQVHKALEIQSDSP